MKFRHPCNVVAAVSVATVCAARLAWAGDMYSVTIVPEPGTTSPFAIGKVSKGVFTVGSNGSKIVIKPSTKAGDGGMTIQLTLKNVDCATYRRRGRPGGQQQGHAGEMRIGEDQDDASHAGSQPCS